MSGRTNFFAGLLAVVGLVFGGMLYAQQRWDGIMGGAEMGVSMLRTRHDVRSVLTPEQRETLASLGGGTMGMDMRGMTDMMRMMGSMQGGMEMMGGDMMQDMEACPMSRGNQDGRSMMQF